MFADRLWLGQSPKQLVGDWLSSDRPPLQAGWLLLTRPEMEVLHFNSDSAAGAGGICFQLIWIPALWAFLRCLGARPRQASAIIIAVAFSGFFLLFTVFAWPKLGAAGLMLVAFVLWWSGPPGPVRFAGGGACAALGCLAHPGVAFSLIGLFPLALAAIAWRRQRRLHWLPAAAAFVFLALPWIAYQRWYEPPGDRLLKMRLAGVFAPDNRGFLKALTESYQQIGWQEAFARRLDNLRLQIAGDWKPLATFHPRAYLVASRYMQVRYTAYAFGWWLPGLIVLPWTAWRQRSRFGGVMGWAVVWWLTGWLVWVAVMFDRNQAIVHQGTPITQLVGFALLAWSAISFRPWLFLGLAGAQIALFCETWIAPMPGTTDGAVDPLAAGVAISAAAIGVVVLIAGGLDDPPRRRTETLREAFHVAFFVGGALTLWLVARWPGPAELHPLEGLTSSRPFDGEGGFAPGAVYPSTNAISVPAGIETRGSWLHTDAFQGSYLTGWFKARSKFTVLVAGYPRLKSMQLEVQVRKRDGSLFSLTFAGENPAESWQPWIIHLPSDAEAIRIHGIDRSSELRSWLGFSEPFADVSWEPRLWTRLRPVVIGILTLVMLGLAVRWGRPLRRLPPGGF